MSEERLDMIRKMLEENPEDAFLNYAAALEYKKRNMTDEAIATLEKLRKTQPDYLGTYYTLGKIYEGLGKEVDAITLYKEGIEVAKSQQDRKIQGELTEALMMLDDGDDWDE